MTSPTLLELRFSHGYNWELLTPVRQFLETYLGRQVGDDDLTAQVCLAAHELLENALKYSRDDEARLQVVLTHDGLIRVVVESWALPEHLDVLAEEVRQLRAAPDATAYYREKMLASVGRTDGRSGLGLARIRCESEMELRCEVDGSRVRLIVERSTAGTTTTAAGGEGEGEGEPAGTP